MRDDQGVNTLQQLLPTTRDVPAVTDAASAVAMLATVKAMDTAKMMAESVVALLDPSVGTQFDQRA